MDQNCRKLIQVMLASKLFVTLRNPYHTPGGIKPFNSSRESNDAEDSFSFIVIQEWEKRVMNYLVLQESDWNKVRQKESGLTVGIEVKLYKSDLSDKLW